jgi:hypothetical protein
METVGKVFHFQGNTINLLQNNYANAKQCYHQI